MNVMWRVVSEIPHSYLLISPGYGQAFQMQRVQASGSMVYAYACVRCLLGFPQVSGFAHM